MTPGDEAGALKEESPVDSAEEAHDDPAPAEADPGAENVKEAPAKAKAKSGLFGRKKAKAEEAASEKDSEKKDEAAPEEDTAASAEDAGEDAGEDSDEDKAPVVEDKAEAEDDEVEAEDKAEAGASAEDEAEDADADASDDQAGDEAPAEEPDEASAGGDQPASAGRWAASVAVLVVLLIVGVATAGMYWSKASATDATGSDKQAAMNTARTAVTDLFTINYQDPSAFATRLKPIAAGQFLTVVNNASAGFAKLMQQGKVQTTGQVQTMGVQKYGGTTAQVAVLAYETVKNSDSPQGSEHPFRMSLSLVKSGSKWLVSNLEFVQ